MSSTDADRLYREALADAVADARQRAEVLARAAGRSLGEITSLSEVGSQAMPYALEAARTPCRGLHARRPRPAGDLRERQRHLLAPLALLPEPPTRVGDAKATLWLRATGSLSCTEEAGQGVTCFPSRRSRCRYRVCLAVLRAPGGDEVGRSPACSRTLVVGLPALGAAELTASGRVAIVRDRMLLLRS